MNLGWTEAHEFFHSIPAQAALSRVPDAELGGISKVGQCESARRAVTRTHCHSRRTVNKSNRMAHDQKHICQLAHLR